jgi:superfamily II DNA or RNA helicase
MFDFKRLATSAVSTAPATLYELFSQLDRKATHASLRSVQVAALKALDAQLANKDLVLKLSTGSGKTVVGLVYAEMMRQRYRGEPVLYLCPTNQLVDQVFFSASSIGVPVSKFERSGIPLTAIPGENVLICTYDRLFNARSTFENHGVRPSCVVLDDVHAGVERVRQNYSAKVPTEYYDQLRALLRPLCEATDPGTWRGIENNPLLDLECCIGAGE